MRLGPTAASGHPELGPRDIDVLTWIGRYGIVRETQLAARFFRRDDGSVGARSATNEVRKLEGLGLLIRAIPQAHHPTVLRISDAGADLVDADIRPAGWVPAELAHSLAVVDLMESLLAEHPGSSVVTERQIRVARGHDDHAGPTHATGRVPDGVLVLKNGKRIAVELDLTAKRSPDVAAIIRTYQKHGDYSAVWWFVRPGVVARMTEVVKESKASRLVEVHAWEGPVGV